LSCSDWTQTRMDNDGLLLLNHELLALAHDRTLRLSRHPPTSNSELYRDPDPRIFSLVLSEEALRKVPPLFMIITQICLSGFCLLAALPQRSKLSFVVSSKTQRSCPQAVTRAMELCGLGSAGILFRISTVGWARQGEVELGVSTAINQGLGRRISASC